MIDRNLSLFFALVWVISMFALVSYLDKPMSAEQYADKLCQELYGPQTGHKWVDATLMCETVRGEVLAIRNTN